MAENAKVRRVDEKLVLVLPAHLVEELSLEEGDELSVEHVGDGLLARRRSQDDFAAALDDARTFMRTHKKAFEELAK